jgi:hypothetical protein
MTPSRCNTWRLLDIAHNASHIEQPSTHRDLAAAACSSGQDQYSGAVESGDAVQRNAPLPLDPGLTPESPYPSHRCWRLVLAGPFYLINNVSHPLAPTRWTCACIYRVHCRDCYQVYLALIRPFLTLSIAVILPLFIPAHENSDISSLWLPRFLPCSFRISLHHSREQLRRSRTLDHRHPRQQRLPGYGTSTRDGLWRKRGKGTGLRKHRIRHVRQPRT